MTIALIDRYRSRLPVSDRTPVISLGEGSTPLLRAPRLSERLGVEIWLKWEASNPTGSYKDRGMTVAVSKAAEDGAEAVICASTGNTAASAAAYAARCSICAASCRPSRAGRSMTRLCVRAWRPGWHARAVCSGPWREHSRRCPAASHPALRIRSANWWLESWHRRCARSRSTCWGRPVR